MIGTVKYSVNRPAIQNVGQCGIEQTRQFKETMVPESCGVLCYADTTVQDLMLHFRLRLGKIMVAQYCEEDGCVRERSDLHSSLYHLKTQC